MQLTHITCLLLLMLGSHHALADDESSTETNEIIPREAIQKLDFSVRQALLRAIDKLEQEANDDNDNDNDNDNGNGEDDNDDVENATAILPSSITIQSTTALPLTSPTKDEILEESTNAADIFPSVQFFTATYDENNAHEQPLAAFIDKTKAHKKTSKNNLGSPNLVATNANPESGDNHQAARSVGTSIQTNEISSNGLDEIKFEIRNSKTSPKSQTTTSTSTTTTTTARPRTTRRRTTTTSTTTTTTTPRPTHNEDGENIEVVDKDDIRIQAAPLVSAFTVDLDELGTAKKVVPIIDTAPPTAATRGSSTQRSPPPQFEPALNFGPTITKLNVLQSDAPKSANNFLAAPQPTQPTFGSSTTLSNIFSNVLPTSGHYITKQPLTSNLNQQPPNNVNNYFYEKQRELEQQIYQLKLQAQQQQELILRQLKLLEEQSRQRHTTANSQSQAQHNQQQQHQQQQHVPTSQQETSFTIRPSVEFIPSTQTKISPLFPTFPQEQQLPLKESNGKFINGVSNKQNPFAAPSQQQQLPAVNNPIQQIFHNLQQKLQNSQAANAQAVSSISSIQIQPSNQLSIGPTFAPSLPQPPAELSLVQALPQRNYQQFQQAPLIPQYVTNAILERQQQQQQQQNPQQHRARLFRQELDTGNFGLNQVQTNPNNIFAAFNQQQQTQQQQQPQNFDSQNFYRQHLNPDISNQLQQNAQQYYQQQQQQQQQSSSQTALNHGINHFAQQQQSAPQSSSNAF